MLAFRRWHIAMLSLLAFAVWGAFLNVSSAHASTVAYYSNYDFFQNYSVSVSAGYGDAGTSPTSVNKTSSDVYGNSSTSIASTAYGSNKAYASATAVQDWSAIAGVTSDWQDTWTVNGGIGQGVMTLIMTLTGSISNTSDMATVNYSFGSSNNFGGYQGISIQQNSFTSPTSYTATLPFDYGVPFTVESNLSLSAAGSLWLHAVDLNFYPTSTLDFSSTALVTQITLPDGATLLTASGATYPPTAVPLPPAVWLLGSGLVGLAGLSRKLKS
jgi:hypothetical protein